MPWAKRITKPIPRISSPQSALEVNDYSLGFNSFISNDKFPVKDGGSNLWRLAQNARITTLGEYGTRKGFDFHSAAAGETQDQAITSTTGAADKSFNAVTRLAQKWTAGASGRLSKHELNLKNDASATGVIIVEHWTDSSGPDELVARTSIASSSVTSTYAYVAARFASAPTVVSGTAYWVVAYVQSGGSGSYKWSGTTSATTAMTSTDSGVSWSATSYALNFKQHYATAGGVKGLHRAYKSDGTSVTLFAHGTALYSVNNVTGALTTVKSGLNASATHYRFVTVNDIVYYCNSYDGLRKWDFTTESQVSSTNYSTLAVHVGLLFGVRTDDPNRVDYSNFGDYETFTSTDFQLVPSAKTGDPVTALKSLNGYLLIFTRSNKYIFSGQDNATFTLDEAPDQKGTYSQETVTADKNFVYYLSDDGVYRSNGTEPQLLSENNYRDILDMTNKDSACIAVTKGRLRLWFTGSGESNNAVCYVWNLNYGSNGSDCLESYDTAAYVNKAVNAFNDEELLVGSSVIGQVYWQELATNDYSNLGGDIDFLLQTHYMTFGSPAVLKQIFHWQPRFRSQTGGYNVSCEYAVDLRDSWNVRIAKDVQGSGPVWGEFVWGSFVWGTTAEVQAKTYVPGEFRRVALRYKHYASRQPQTFLGHTLVVQTRRLT